MKPVQKPKGKIDSADYTLLFARIENELLKSGDEMKWRKVLSNKAIWIKLKPSHQLKWARLAQMAGEIETTLQILEEINRREPDLTEAWEQRLELLSILDRREEMARTLVAAKSVAGGRKYEQWSQRFSIARPLDAAHDKDIGASAAPFEKLRQRQALIGRYMQLFSGRKDCFARQWVDKAAGKQGYVPVRRPLEPTDVEAHLKGSRTYGIYLMKTDGTVNTAVIDADLHSRYREGKISAEAKRQVYRERNYLISRIRELSKEAGMTPLVEFSGGKGFHFWYFFDPAPRAGSIRSLLADIKEAVAADLSAFNLEIFPKQNQLKGKGFGNLVKLPLGIHRLTGKRSFFPDCRDRSEDAQLKFLLHIRASDPRQHKRLVAERETDSIYVHPRWQKWTKNHPELYTLEKRCPPLAQIISACRNGGTLSTREEKIIYQTVGFLPAAKSQLHTLLRLAGDYNPHLVDFKLSRIRGTPLGCRRIHSLLGFEGDLCHFSGSAGYPHPLLHLENWQNERTAKSEKVESLAAALENLKISILQVERFLS